MTILSTCIIALFVVTSTVNLLLDIRLVAEDSNKLANVQGGLLFFRREYIL